MSKPSIRWREVVPWTLLGVVLSCGGAAIAPATAPTANKFTSLETEELVLRGKDGAVRGKMTADGLALIDPAGNSVEISVGETAAVTVRSASGNGAMIAVDQATGTLLLSAGGRKIAAGVETERPLADIEVFDANDKRRVSLGLNSNGDPRISLYDAAETRRLYGILFDDVALLHLNDKSGDPAVELFGADAARGSGVSVTHAAKTTNMGVGTDGKPLR